MTYPIAEHDPVALFGPGPSLLSMPQLPEAPCSINMFFEVNGMKGQATGRGDTPKKAVANLQETMEEARRAFAPPVPQLTMAQRLAKYAACAIEKAIEREEYDRLSCIGEAVALAARGSVYADPSRPNVFIVWDHVGIDRVFVKENGHCDCVEDRWRCAHSMAVWFAKRVGMVGSADEGPRSWKDGSVSA